MLQNKISVPIKMSFGDIKVIEIVIDFTLQEFYTWIKKGEQIVTTHVLDSSYNYDKDLIPVDQNQTITKDNDDESIQSVKNGFVLGHSISGLESAIKENVSIRGNLFKNDLIRIQYVKKNLLKTIQNQESLTGNQKSKLISIFKTLKNNPSEFSEKVIQIIQDDKSETPLHLLLLGVLTE
jgi:hypothetical protein